MDAIQLAESTITCVAGCRKGKTESLLERGTRVRITVSGIGAILDEVLEADSNVKLGCEISTLEKVE